MCKTCDSMKRERGKLPTLTYPKTKRASQVLTSRLKRRRPFMFDTGKEILYVDSHGWASAKQGRYYRESRGHIKNIMKGK